MKGPMSVRWALGTVVMLLIFGLSACAHTLPADAPVVDRVLAEKALRVQLIERGAADLEFVHEILHQLGQGPEGDQRVAQLLAEHLGHHPSTARAVFQQLALGKEFQEWIIERLRIRKAVP